LGSLIVHRKGYWRKGFTIIRNGKKIRIPKAYIPPTTYRIKDRGKRGRGKKVIKVKRGALSKYGYSTSKSAEARHRALAKAIRVYGARKVWRMLHAQVVLRKRIQRRVRKIFEADRDWVKRRYL